LDELIDVEHDGGEDDLGANPGDPRYHPVRTTAKLGVYVHFPFCLRRCPYCDFSSTARERQALPHAAYADAVISELDRRREALGDRTLASVFFGGGTPSLWEPKELGRVLRAIRASFTPLSAAEGELEVTVECNPSSFDADRARALLDVGVDRVSIGVQSLDASRLAFLGRLHDGPGALAAVEAALGSGIPRVSVDLIFGAHGQTSAAAELEAASIADLGVTHLSAYALTIEPGTQFGALARRGALPLCPDEEVAESFLAIDRALEKRGFDHYEISNYARPGHESRHNLGYWIGREYLGLGSAAWGTLTLGSERVRYRNERVPERYMAGAPETEREIIDPETALRERILLGLRLACGLDLTAAGRELDVEPWTAERVRAVERLVARGRLERDGDVLRIPKPAWLFADGTIAELL
jgi:oxygen-independent coproporphyrinogen-3 oxidase